MTTPLEQKEARRVELQRLNVVQLTEICKQGVPRSAWSTGMIQGILNFEFPDLKPPEKSGGGCQAS